MVFQFGILTVSCLHFVKLLNTGSGFLFKLINKTQHWTVPQMSIIIIYNSTWSILIHLDYIVRWQSDLKTQKKDPFTSLHKIKANLPHWAEFDFLRNGASCYLLSHCTDWQQWDNFIYFLKCNNTGKKLHWVKCNQLNVVIF